MGVIPTVLVGGPLAILALLFPAVFGGLLLLMRRWIAVLTVASLNSTLFLLHSWFYPSIKSTWWGTPLAFWIGMTSTTVLGLLWAWRRHRATLCNGAANEKPGRWELALLVLLALAGIVMVIYSVVSNQSLLGATQKTMLVIWTGAWAGLAYALYRRWVGGPRPAFSTEAIMLGAMALACTGLTAAAWPRPAKEQGADVVWALEIEDLHGRVASTILIDDAHAYVAASVDDVFSPHGMVYCLNKDTGEILWRFDDGGTLKPMFSSPRIDNGRLYFGEGFHQDSYCKLYCLDAATGKKHWHIQTKSHTESSPTIVDGKVYFGAGDDGIYCANAENGKIVWHFEGVHVDSNPLIHDGRLYAGSGYGLFELLCLDIEKGQPIWRVPVDLPAFATPSLAGEHIVFGIGNGNLMETVANPAGALICVDRKTGERTWRCDVGDGVHRRPIVDDQFVYCTTRDANCYCIRLSDGAIAWKQDLGSPILTRPFLVQATHYEEQSSLYVITSEGMVFSLNPAGGETRWTFDVMSHSGRETSMLSSPIVEVQQTPQGQRRRIYFGAELKYGTSSTPAVYCLEERN